MATIGPGDFFALPILIGRKLSTYFYPHSNDGLWFLVTRVKDMLRSGNFSVSGDQWPILLYQDELYDSENPWKGLFKNKLLILVSVQSAVIFFAADTFAKGI